MKKNSTPELTARWWSANQPDGLGTARDLERALADFEAARGSLLKGGRGELAACLKALDQAEAAARKAQTEAAKLADAPPKKAKSDAEDYHNTLEALKKFSRVADATRRELEAHAAKAGGGDDDEDDDEGVLGDPDTYKAYLKKTCNRLRRTPLNVAIGLGKKPHEHRLLFHKSKPGKAMMASLRNETGLKKLTWGIAGANEDSPITLTLALEGPQLSAIKRKCELLLKAMKPLPFSKVLLMVEGEPVEDFVDPEDQADIVDLDEGEPAASAGTVEPADPAAALKARIAALLPRIQAATAAAHPEAQNAKLRTSEAGVALRKQDFANAAALLDQAEALLGTAAPSPATPSAPRAFSIVNAQKARLAWLATRKAVHGELQKLEQAIVAEFDGDEEFAELGADLRKLDQVLENLDESLADKLDLALNASGAARDALHDEAVTLLDAYQEYVDSHPLVEHLDANPFLDLKIRDTVQKSLGVIRKAIA